MLTKWWSELECDESCHYSYEIGNTNSNISRKINFFFPKSNFLELSFFRYRMPLFIVTWLVNWDVLEEEKRKNVNQKKAKKNIQKKTLSFVGLFSIRDEVNGRVFF